VHHVGIFSKVNWSLFVIETETLSHMTGGN